ncbi:hypothetical protein AOL_s00173g230 [Orbilia oligospora ATCC 24927]|uniref:Uncharacterized protein n=1 Tax=Arthrobotrys oligospora (strain ATCC 24927 / CBS 115.81 / DSM 1491) TaxID=756982 RepID=G1XP62_ARTOA|nr:hypothetical protein AOL_s00173g230 [Orbilia oligospora ATCC 24927]EGX45129.1 hypothetical protein AOL_s00173g230 [Orbilia oligospora ATCC 24927]
MPKFKITLDIPTKEPAEGAASPSPTPKLSGRIITSSPLGTRATTTPRSSQTKSEMTNELRKLCKPNDYSVESLLNRKGEGQAPFSQATMTNWRKKTMERFDQIEEINENLRRACLQEKADKNSGPSPRNKGRLPSIPEEETLDHHSSPVGTASSVISYKKNLSVVSANPSNRGSGCENPSSDMKTENPRSGSLRSNGRSRIPTTYDFHGNVQQHQPVSSTIGRKFPATYDQHGNVQHILSHGSQAGSRIPLTHDQSSSSRAGSSRHTSSQSSQYTPSQGSSSHYPRSESTSHCGQSESSRYSSDPDPSRSSRYTSLSGSEYTPSGSEYTPSESSRGDSLSSSRYTTAESSRHNSKPPESSYYTPSEGSRSSRRPPSSSSRYTSLEVSQQTITPSDSASNYGRSEISRASHRASSSSAQYTTTESSRRSSRPPSSSCYTPPESSRASRKTPPSSSSGSRATYGSSTPAPPGSVTGSHKNARRYGDKPFGTAESRRFEDPYGTDATQPSSSSRSHHSSSSRRH